MGSDQPTLDAHFAAALHTAHRQAGYALRADWGPTGADAVTPDCEVAVVVDVLSFTTTLTVAADRKRHGVPLPLAR